MKRNILRVLITTVLVIAALMTFAQDQKTAASDTVMDLPRFKHAKIDSAVDFNRFKTDAQLNIANNKKAIAELKERKLKGTKDARAKYKEQVLKLEETNDQMDIRINTSDMMQTARWTGFKREFNLEMTKLTTSIRDMADNKFNH